MSFFVLSITPITGNVWVVAQFVQIEWWSPMGKSPAYLLQTEVDIPDVACPCSAKVLCLIGPY